MRESPISPEEFLDSSIGESPNFAAIQAGRTSKKDYLKSYIYLNITSHSQQEVLNECPRKFAIMKIPKTVDSGEAFQNIDFAFGHSVGAGIQTYLVTKDRNQALLASFLAWNIDYYLEDEKKKKSCWWAALAVEKFIHWWAASWEAEWELAYFNGKPTTELVFFVDAENGYYHVGHIDAILRNKKTGIYMVLEIKTTSMRLPDEAQHGNSAQALGYSIILDKIAVDFKDAAMYEVLYVIYSSTERDFTAFPFMKSRTQRMDWLQNLLLDHVQIKTYKQLNFFPKRGSSCWSFNKRCPHYGVCDLSPAALGGGKAADGKKIGEVMLMFDPTTMKFPEQLDFQFKLSDLVDSVLKAGTSKFDNNTTLDMPLEEQ